MNASEILAEAKPTIDLRSIFNIYTNILSLFGLVLNLFLCYLIFFKTPKVVSDYKTVLIQNCFVDIFYNAVNDVVKGQTDYKWGTFYIIANDWLKLLPHPYYVYFVLCWVFSLFFCFTSLAVQYIFRYYVICHGKPMPNVHYFIILFTSMFGALSYAAFYGWASWPEKILHESKAKLLKEDLYYFHGIPIFMVGEIQKWLMKLCFRYGFILILIIFGIILNTYIKVWKELKYHESNFSATTKIMHKQMTRTMILQTSVPQIFLLFPIGVAKVVTFFVINIPGLGMILNSLCSIAPVANPLVTIISVNSSREFIIKIFQKVFKKPKLRSVVPF